MESQTNNTPSFHPIPGLTLMEQMREVLRYFHYAYRNAYRTEQTNARWLFRYLQYIGSKTHPKRLGTKEVKRLAHV